MAIGYFPNLYPDEILGSAVARYRVHTMASFDAHVNKELYGKGQLHTSIALPRGLIDLHELIEPFIGLSLEELVSRATLYPYYTAFANKDTKARILRKMLQQRQGQRGQHRIGGREPPIIRMKVCQSCISEDVVRFGESYWHRTHQLDCVHFCEKHITPLMEAVVPIGTRKALCALTPQVVTRPYLPYLSERSRQRLFEIASLARQYLDGSIIHDRTITRSSPPKAFRDLYALGRFLNTTNIRRDFIHFFGNQCLDILGIQLTQENKIDWIRDIFSSRWIPIKHVATQLFHHEFAIPRCALVRGKDHVQEKIKMRVWKCQNPAAPHFGQRVITNVHLTKDFERNGGVVFKCTCGYHFFIQSKSWNFYSEPTERKVFEFGDLFIKTVRELKLQGMRNIDIAKRLEVSDGVIRRMLEPGYDSRLTRKYGIEDARFASRLQSTKKIAEKRRDFAAEPFDEELAKKIEETAGLLLMQAPPKRATANRILEVAEISVERLFSRPYCLAALSALQYHTETAAAFRQREACFEENKSLL
jgi:hypothetical protein